MKCPLCGSNKYKCKNENKFNLAAKLRKKGLSLRQIAKCMNVSSPNTVFYYLAKAEGK